MSVRPPDDDDFPSGRVCPTCGELLEWKDCPGCEDGYVDDTEDDGVNFWPPDVRLCGTCNGRSGWWACRRAPHGEKTT